MEVKRLLRPVREELECFKRAHGEPPSELSCCIWAGAVRAAESATRRHLLLSREWQSKQQPMVHRHGPSMSLWFVPVVPLPLHTHSWGIHFDTRYCPIRLYSSCGTTLWSNGYRATCAQGTQEGMTALTSKWKLPPGRKTFACAANQKWQCEASCKRSGLPSRCVQQALTLLH